MSQKFPSFSFTPSFQEWSSGIPCTCELSQRGNGHVFDGHKATCPKAEAAKAWSEAGKALYASMPKKVETTDVAA